MSKRLIVSLRASPRHLLSEARQGLNFVAASFSWAPLTLAL